MVVFDHIEKLILWTGVDQALGWGQRPLRRAEELFKVSGAQRYAEDLAREAALGLATIRRAEGMENVTSMTAANDLAVRRALEAAGVEFIDENGGGPGVRLRKG